MQRVLVHMASSRSRRTDITEYTSADFLSKVWNKTPAFLPLLNCDRWQKFCRHCPGQLEGFAFKLYTEEGDLDWVSSYECLAQKKHPPRTLNLHQNPSS